MPDLRRWRWVSLSIYKPVLLKSVVSIVTDRDSFYRSTQPTYCQMSTRPSRWIKQAKQDGSAVAVQQVECRFCARSKHRCLRSIFEVLGVWLSG